MRKVSKLISDSEAQRLANDSSHIFVYFEDGEVSIQMERGWVERSTYVDHFGDIQTDYYYVYLQHPYV